VIVRRERRNGAVVYVLHAAHGADQYVLHTRDESVAQALTFASGRACERGTPMVEATPLYFWRTSCKWNRPLTNEESSWQELRLIREPN
jgi:hypothetical protein